MTTRTAILRAIGGDSSSIPLAGIRRVEDVGNNKTWVQVEDAYTRLWMAGRYMVADNRMIVDGVSFPDFPLEA